MEAAMVPPHNDENGRNIDEHHNTAAKQDGSNNKAYTGDNADD